MSVDLSDVGIIGNATALCERYPAAIFAASDSCAYVGSRGVKTWLRNVAVSANFSLASSPLLDRFLRSKALAVPMVFNSGVAGGRRDTFAPFVRSMARAVRAHHARGAVAWRLVDMLVFNELILQRLVQTTEALAKPPPGGLGWNRTVVTGWPFGEFNLPMWGFMCGRDPCTQNNLSKGWDFGELSGCLRRHVLQMAPSYAFAHKVSYLTFPRQKWNE